MIVISKDTKKASEPKENKELAESLDSIELRKSLETIQTILHSKNANLSDAEKLLVNQIVTSAEEQNIISSFVDVDENGLIFDFKLDHGSKEIFTDFSSSITIDAINSLQKSRYKKSRKMTFNFTEYFKVVGDNKKSFIRGDLSGLIKDGLEDDVTDISLIEFQATHDSEVLPRVHAYGNNNLKLVRRCIKKMKKNKRVMVEDDVFVRPYEMIIYASTKFKKKEGVFRFNVTAPYFESNGVKRRGIRGDVITYFIPFINIFQMSLEELNNSKFFFLQCLYLYKYRQNKKLLEKEEHMAEIASQIERNLREKLSDKDFEIAMKQHKNLCSDLCKIAEQNPDKYRKVHYDMITIRETYFEKVAREAAEKATKIATEKATKKAEQKAYEKEINMVLKMIKDNLTDDMISNYVELTLEEIAKIRNEHSNI